MRILVVSDTHGRTYSLDRVIENEPSIDYFIHLGDICDTYLTTKNPIECPKAIIVGNNDFAGTYPRNMELELAGKKIWLNHGHRYGIHYGTDYIKNAGRDMGIDIVMCGHTHVPLVEVDADITVINPGSLTYPRQENCLPSYIIMEISENNEVDYSIRYLDI